MDSSEETTYFVDRWEVVLDSIPASQISADKLPITCGQVEVNTNAIEVQSSCEQYLQTLGKFERSEVSVEIQGLRETTFSTTETVVNDRVRTVYSRSLSGSTSSTELDHTESFADSSQETEHPVFGENAYLDGEQRERRTSDSYYISQTYQINTEETSSKSMTTVKSVSFKSSKDFELGNHENVSEEATLHFVDRVEEIIAGENPEAVGSPKEKHVRFLWYDNEQEDIEAQRRIQSAREEVQHLIASTYMVSDITDVVNDNCMGPDSSHLKPTASGDRKVAEELVERGSELLIGIGRQTSGVSQNMARVETKDLNLLPGEITEWAYVQAGSTGDTAHITSSKSLASSEVTLAFSTWYSDAGDAYQVTTASTVKPTGFPTEFEPADSLTTDRRSTLAYSPGMAIRSYALEELEERKYRVTPDRTEAEAKSLRFDEESSGVDVDKGSSVDDLNSLTAQSTAELNIVSNESFVADSLDSQRFAVQTGRTPVQEMSREEEDESLDKLVDLESIQVGYRFHDVGIMQEYGGICNLAFDDSDEHETVNSSEDRTSSLHSQGVANIHMLISEAASNGSSEILSRSLLVKEKDSLTSDSKGSHSAVEYSTSFLPNTASSSTISQDTSRQASNIQHNSASVRSSFITEDITSTSEFSQREIKTNNAPYTTQVKQTRTTFQTVQSEQQVKEQLNRTDLSSDQVKQKSVDAVENTDFVKELESVIEAGEKAIQKLAQSLEQADFENIKSQDNLQELKEAEDISIRKEAEIAQSFQAGEYRSGYTSVEGRGHVNLVYPASEAVPAGKTVGKFGEENDLGDGVTTDHGTGGAFAVGGSENVENVEKADVIGDTVTYGNTTKSSIHREVESTLRTVRSDNAEYTVVTNSAALASEGGSTLYKQEVYRAEASTENRQTHVFSEARSLAHVSEVSKGVLHDRYDGKAGLDQADNVTFITEAESASGIMKDNLESRRQDNTTVSSRRVDNAVISRGEQTVLGSVDAEDASKLLEVVNATITTDSAVYISGVSASTFSNKTQHAVKAADAASDISVDAGHKQDGEGWYSSNVRGEPDKQAEDGRYRSNVRAEPDRQDGEGWYRSNVRGEPNKQDEGWYHSNVRGEQDKQDEDGWYRSNVRGEPYKQDEEGRYRSNVRGEPYKQDEEGWYRSNVRGEPYKQNEEGRYRSNVGGEPDQQAHLGQVEAEFVERVIQTTVAAEQANARSNVGMAVTTSSAGEYSRGDAVSIKEISGTKKASRNKKKSRVIETSKIEETSRIEEASKQEVTALQTKVPIQHASVTRKFNVSKKFEASLKAQGASLKSESISIAVYYDTPEFTLTLSDCWLRSLNSKWQLHSSFTKLLNEVTKHQYSESEDKGVILSSLADLLQCPLPRDPDLSIAMFVQKSGLREFVRYTTIHKTYSWKGMTIQLELPEYGFWVGSVTVPPSCKVELGEAVSIIDSFWKTTGKLRYLHLSVDTTDFSPTLFAHGLARPSSNPLPTLLSILQ